MPNFLTTPPVNAFWRLNIKLLQLLFMNVTVVDKLCAIPIFRLSNKVKYGQTSKFLFCHKNILDKKSGCKNSLTEHFALQLQIY